MPSPEASAERRLGGDDRRLLAAAAGSAVAAAARADAYVARLAPPGSVLGSPGASFVSLHRRGALRGCMGSLEPRRALLADVVANARCAALADPRFPPVGVDELPELEVEVSVLTPCEAILAADEAALLAALTPGLDGVVLECGGRRATFLPAVWEQLPEPRRFLAALREKAGLAAAGWEPGLRFGRYRVERIATRCPAD